MTHGRRDRRSAPPSEDRRWKVVDARMRRLGHRPDALVEALHSVQDSFGFLDRDSLEYVASSLRLPPSRVYGVATFYSYFTLQPPGEHTCVVCMGTACYINGATKILDGVVESLGVSAGQTTRTVRSRSSPRTASAHAASLPS